MPQPSTTARSATHRVNGIDDPFIPRTGLSHGQPRFFSRHASDLIGSREPQMDHLIHITQQFQPQAYLFERPSGSFMAPNRPRNASSGFSPLSQQPVSTLANSDRNNEAIFAQDFSSLAASCLPLMVESNGPAVEDTFLPFDEQTDDIRINLTSTGRKSRSHVWPPMSNAPPLVPFPSEFRTRTIGHTGRDSGRNLLALFEGGDGIPRTRHNLRILRARGPTYLPDIQHYPPSNVDIPGGMSLWEICQFYPRHVWGTCLRMFIAEGWAGEQIFNALPMDFKDSKAVQRPWNYIQQGFTREVRRMNEESGVLVRNARKSKRVQDIDDIVRRTGRPRVMPSVSSKSDINVSPYSETAAASHAHMQEPSVVIKDERTDKLMSEKWSLGNATNGELEKQEILLLAIMKAFRPDLSNKSLDEQLDRVRYCRQNICQQHDIDLENAPLEQLAELTFRLEEVLQKALQPSDCARECFSESVEEADNAAQEYSPSSNLDSNGGHFDDTRAAFDME